MPGRQERTPRLMKVSLGFSVSEYLAVSQPRTGGQHNGNFHTGRRAQPNFDAASEVGVEPAPCIATALAHSARHSANRSHRSADAPSSETTRSCRQSPGHRNEPVHVRQGPRLDAPPSGIPEQSEPRGSRSNRPHRVLPEPLTVGERRHQRSGHNGSHGLRSGPSRRQSG